MVSLFDSIQQKFYDIFSFLIRFTNKLVLDFKVHHSYLFVGKSYQERENLIQLLLYRIHERNQQVFIIDDLFCKNANESNIIHTDEIKNVQELIRSSL